MEVVRDGRVAPKIRNVLLAAPDVDVVNTFTTPLGSPASSRILAIIVAVPGVFEAGFMTTVLPMRSDGASCQTLIIIGQFHGPMAPTTPSGR